MNNLCSNAYNQSTSVIDNKNYFEEDLSTERDHKVLELGEFNEFAGPEERPR
jgi:hypothetical protein